MTDPRTQFLIQVLDKIGGPLTSAVAAGPALESEAAGAQRLAELLNRSVQLGLSVADQMNVRDEGQADGVHLSLTAFASPLMAGQYLLSGRVPGDTEIKRLSTALQAVLTFADNFTPAADSTLRIQSTEAGSQPADEAVIYVQTLTAFGPVFQVVNDYAFGKSENKIIQDISTRLLNKATELREGLFGTEQPIKTRRQIDLVLMKLLCNLYASCHTAEVRRLMALSDQAKAGVAISLDPVWAAFDKQAAMAKVVAEQIVPIEKSETSSAETIQRGVQKAATKITESKTPAKAAGGGIPGMPLKTPVKGREGPKKTSIPEKKPPDSNKPNPMAFFAPGAKDEADEDEA